MDNANPLVFESAGVRPYCPEDDLDNVHDAIDSREVFGESDSIVAVSYKTLSRVRKYIMFWEIGLCL